MGSASMEILTLSEHFINNIPQVLVSLVILCNALSVLYVTSVSCAYPPPPPLLTPLSRE